MWRRAVRHTAVADTGGGTGQTARAHVTGGHSRVRERRACACTHTVVLLLRTLPMWLFPPNATGYLYACLASNLDGWGLKLGELEPSLRQLHGLYTLQLSKQA